VGPNLGLDELEYATVVWMVQNGNSTMPGFRGTLKPAQIDEAATFVIAATTG
jgi:mono/diheme cytochrome c family protein